MHAVMSRHQSPKVHLLPLQGVSVAVTDPTCGMRDICLWNKVRKHEHVGCSAGPLLTGPMKVVLLPEVPQLTDPWCAGCHK